MGYINSRGYVKWLDDNAKRVIGENKYPMDWDKYQSRKADIEIALVSLGWFAFVAIMIAIIEVFVK